MTLKEIAIGDIEPDKQYLVRVNSLCSPNDYELGLSNSEGEIIHEHSGTDLTEYAIAIYEIP